MPIIPFRARVKDLSPGWLQNGTGERLMYVFGLGEDMTVDREVQATNAHMPTRAEADAQAIIGSDRLIPRGLTEGNDSYGRRLQGAFDAHRLGGTSRGVMSQVLGYLLSYTPKIQIVWSTFDRDGTWPPSLVSSTWDVYPEGRPLTSEPVHTYVTSGGAGELDWDSTSPITGSWGSWSCYMVIYATSQAWIGQAQAWGEGSTYSGTGYYSTVSGGAYVLAGSYAGTSQAWGEGSTYTPSADGYYSKVVNGRYELAGRYTGVSQAWGVDASSSVGQSIARIAKLFKLSNAWVRSIIVSFDDALFDPSAPSGGGINPDGTFGQWSTVSAGEYVESRFTSAVYSGEVV